MGAAYNRGGEMCEKFEEFLKKSKSFQAVQGELSQMRNSVQTISEGMAANHNMVLTSLEALSHKLDGNSGSSGRKQPPPAGGGGTQGSQALPASKRVCLPGASKGPGCEAVAVAHRPSPRVCEDEIGDFLMNLFPNREVMDKMGVSEDMHSLLCGLFNTNPEAPRFKSFQVLFGKGKAAPFWEWWKVVKSCKGRDQWRSFLVSVGLEEGMATTFNKWEDFAIGLVGILVREGKVQVPGVDDDVAEIEIVQAAEKDLPKWEGL